MQAAMTDDDYRDYEAFIAGDQAFHLALVRCTGQLVEMYSNLNVHTGIARARYTDSVERAHQTSREHEAIVDAFDGGDAEMVGQTLRLHIEIAEKRLLEIVREHGGSL